MLEFVLSGLGSVTGYLIDFSGKKVVLVKDLGVTVCNTLEQHNPGFIFLADESISRCSTLLWENEGKPIQTIKAIRDEYGWGLRKAKFAWQVSIWKDVTSCEPIEFTVNARSFAPLTRTVSSSRLLIEVGGQYGIPTFIKIEILNQDGGDKFLLDELFQWAQNEEVPWIHTSSPKFRILSCSDETCCSMSYGDKVTVYSEASGFPGSERKYLCDHYGWSAM